MKMKNIIILFLSILISVKGYADNPRIYLLDKETQKPILYANLCFEGLKTSKKDYKTTSNKGYANNPVSEKSVIIISFVGYKTITDTILPGESKTYLMEQDLLNLEQVVVTGTRTEKRLANVPIKTIVISKNEIKKSGAVSTMEALQDYIPGIVTNPNGMGNNMRIRGLNSRYILFLVDGERMVSEGAGGNINLNQIDFNNIERIEIVNEAASALYGSNAVGGVINIITKNPIHKFEAGANGSYQNYNTKKFQVNVGSNQKKLSIRANAFRNSSDGFDIENGSYAASYTDYGTNLKLGYKFTNKIVVNLNGSFFQHETFNPDNSMNVTHDMDRKLTIGAHVSIQSKDCCNNLKISTNFDKYYTYKVLEKKNDKLEKGNEASYISTRIVDTYSPNEKWEIVVGTEYNHEKILTVNSTILGSDPTAKTIDDINLFGQGQYTILTGFDVIIGARYTYNNQFKSAFTPKLSLMYKIGKFTFRGGLGNSFRAPSIKELYYDFNHQGAFWIYGNPDLKAEKGFFSSFSTELTVKNLNTSVSLYHNKIDNKITQYIIIDSEGKENRYYKNVSSATLKGFDFNMSYLFFKQFVLKGSYSYCDAHDDLTGLQLESNVKHSGTMSITWNGKVLNSPFSLQLAGRMNSPKLYQSLTTGSEGNEIIIYEKSNSYNIWKATLVKPFRIKQHQIELTLKCDNIFGFKEKSFTNPGQQYLIGLKYKFK